MNKNNRLFDELTRLSEKKEGSELNVFISQPMGGKTDKEVLEERKYIEKNIKRKYENIKIIDSFLDDDEELKPLHYLAISLWLMTYADIVVFAKGWERARGCKIERLACENYGIKYIEIEELERGEENAEERDETDEKAKDFYS